MQPQFAAALPPHVPPARFVRVAMGAAAGRAKDADPYPIVVHALSSKLLPIVREYMAKLDNSWEAVAAVDEAMHAAVRQVIEEVGLKR